MTGLILYSQIVLSHLHHLMYLKKLSYKILVKAPASKRRLLTSLLILAISVAIIVLSIINISNLLRDSRLTSSETTSNTQTTNLAKNEQAETHSNAGSPMSQVGSEVEMAPIPKIDSENVPQLPKTAGVAQYDKYDKIDSKTGQTQKVASQQPRTEKEGKKLQENSLIPTRTLILPTINVASPIVDILISNNNWDISGLDENVGMLEGFPQHPDEPGAMVVAAHATVQWPIGGPFLDLRLMELGDPIIFQIDDTEYVYEVSRFLRIATSSVHLLKKNGEDGIVLVTCGSYNILTGNYGKRLVVYGHLVETRQVKAENIKPEA